MNTHQAAFKYLFVMFNVCNIHKMTRCRNDTDVLDTGASGHKLVKNVVVIIVAMKINAFESCP